MKSNIKLLEAAEAGEIETLRKLLALVADVHAKCYYEHSDGPLREAVENGHTEVVKLLLDSGADIHVKDCMGIDAPLRLAIRNSHIEIIKLLLDRYPDIQAANRTAFHWAIEYCQLDSMALLLDRGVTVNGANDSWLVQAALNGFTAVVELLLDHGADIHGGNDSALFFAADCRHDETAELLIEYGNFRTEAPGLALTAYSTMGKTKDVEILIRQSADLHTNDDAALRSAAWNNHSDIISLLVGHYEIFELRAIQSTTEAPNLLEAIHIEIQKRLDIRKALRNTPEIEI